MHLVLGAVSKPIHAKERKGSPSTDSFSQWIKYRGELSHLFLPHPFCYIAQSLSHKYTAQLCYVFKLLELILCAVIDGTLILCSCLVWQHCCSNRVLFWAVPACGDIWVHNLGIVLVHEDQQFILYLFGFTTITINIKGCILGTRCTLAMWTL